MHEMTKNDKGTKILFKRVYHWVLNAKGNLELKAGLDPEDKRIKKLGVDPSTATEDIE